MSNLKSKVYRFKFIPTQAINKLFLCTESQATYGLFSVKARDDDRWQTQDLEDTGTSFSHSFISHYNTSASLCIHYCLLLAFPFLPYKMAASIYVLPLPASMGIVLQYIINFNKPSKYLKFSWCLFHVYETNLGSHIKIISRLNFWFHPESQVCSDILWIIFLKPTSSKT